MTFQPFPDSTCGKQSGFIKKIVMQFYDFESGDKSTFSLTTKRIKSF